MSWEEVNKNLSPRKTDSLDSVIQEFNPNQKIKSDVTIIKSSFEAGVIRNGGRSGSLYGPRAIVSALKKMSKHGVLKTIAVTETCLESEFIKQDFDNFQLSQSLYLENILDNQSDTFIHIGSGHDFIYPFAYSVSKKTSKIAIINFDAHLDTRIDKVHHSGTPFRQLAKQLKENLKLIQIGIHDFANASTNFKDIDMQIITTDQVNEQTSKMTTNKAFIQSILANLKDFDTVILSLDLDAIKSEQMNAVSAPNHNGLDLDFIRDFITEYKKLDLQKKYLGIYEYNPLFDDLALANGRRINSLILEFIK